MNYNGLRKQENIHKESNQWRREKKICLHQNPVPISQGIQADFPNLENSRLSSGGSRYLHCSCNLGQEHSRFKREYYKEEKNPYGRGPREGSQGTYQDSQRFIYDSRYIICKCNTIVYFTNLKYYLHYGGPSK